MKKYRFLAAFVLLFVLVGCQSTEEDPRQLHDFYNEEDEYDFILSEDSPFGGIEAFGYRSGRTSKFELVNIGSVLSGQIIKRAEIDGEQFVFAGKAAGESGESLDLIDHYYGYARNTRGGIYFFQIPTSMVRLYQDATDEPYLVGIRHRKDTENEWKKYYMFNLHVKPGTVLSDGSLEVIQGLSK